jgi:hypothetical protein
MALKIRQKISCPVASTTRPLWRSLIIILLSRCIRVIGVFPFALVVYKTEIVVENGPDDFSARHQLLHDHFAAMHLCVPVLEYVAAIGVPSISLDHHPRTFWIAANTSAGLRLTVMRAVKSCPFMRSSMLVRICEVAFGKRAAARVANGIQP